MMVALFRKATLRLNLDGKEHRWKRILFILLTISVVFKGVVILFISPITKYLVEKYDVQYTGREIAIDRAIVNPFTGNN